MSGAALHGYRADALAAKRRRSVVTPEGVDLKLEIAGAGQRLAALMIDFILQGMVILGFVLLFGAMSLREGAVFPVLLQLGIFFLVNFWFVGFELGPRAATPGKRIVGIRVVARDGGQLTVASVIARNFVRQLEIILPLQFLIGGAGGDAVSGGIVILGLMWTLGMGFFLLFNRDRMRLGDIIAGTWVVVARRTRMARDIASTPVAQEPGAPVFTAEELSVYGVFELQELERVLRQGDRDGMIAVADAIRAKLGRPLAEDDRLFLVSYYRQLKEKQERDLLFGKRRANKFEELK